MEEPQRKPDTNSRWLAAVGVVLLLCIIYAVRHTSNGHRDRNLGSGSANPSIVVAATPAIVTIQTPTPEPGKIIDSVSGKPIPTAWWDKYQLHAEDPSIAFEDPDADGFLNEDEWRHSSDPTDKTSHPSYLTKLRLKHLMKVPFRFKFQAYDGDPKKPSFMEFQINSLDLRTPDEFAKLGDTVARVFKLKSFQYIDCVIPRRGKRM